MPTHSIPTYFREISVYASQEEEIDTKGPHAKVKVVANALPAVQMMDHLTMLPGFIESLPQVGNHRKTFQTLVAFIINCQRNYQSSDDYLLSTVVRRQNLTTYTSLYFCHKLFFSFRLQKKISARHIPLFRVLLMKHRREMSSYYFQDSTH